MPYSVSVYRTTGLFYSTLLSYRDIVKLVNSHGDGKPSAKLPFLRVSFVNRLLHFLKNAAISEDTDISTQLYEIVSNYIMVNQASDMKMTNFLFKAYAGDVTFALSDTPLKVSKVVHNDIRKHFATHTKQTNKLLNNKDLDQFVRDKALLTWFVWYCESIAVPFLISFIEDTSLRTDNVKSRDLLIERINAMKPKPASNMQAPVGSDANSDIAMLPNSHGHASDTESDSMRPVSGVYEGDVERKGNGDDVHDVIEADTSGELPDVDFTSSSSSDSDSDDSGSGSGSDGSGSDSDSDSNDSASDTDGDVVINIVPSRSATRTLAPAAVTETPADAISELKSDYSFSDNDGVADVADAADVTSVPSSSKKDHVSPAIDTRPYTPTSYIELHTGTEAIKTALNTFKKHKV